MHAQIDEKRSAKTTLQPAVPDLHTLFPAKREAAYFGYERGMYMKSDCIVKKWPMTKMPTPTRGTDQWMLESEVHANVNRQMVGGTSRRWRGRGGVLARAGRCGCCRDHVKVQVGEVGEKSNRHANETRQKGKASLS